MYSDTDSTFATEQELADALSESFQLSLGQQTNSQNPFLLQLNALVLQNSLLMTNLQNWEHRQTTQTNQTNGEILQESHQNSDQTNLESSLDLVQRMSTEIAVILGSLGSYNTEQKLSQLNLKGFPQFRAGAG